jgi:hypothetical protein
VCVCVCVCEELSYGKLEVSKNNYRNDGFVPQELLWLLV